MVAECIRNVAKGSRLWRAGKESKEVQKIESEFEMNRLVEELNEGVHMGQSVELLFEHQEGRQLMCELLHMYALQLVTVCNCFPDVVRERYEEISYEKRPSIIQMHRGVLSLLWRRWQSQQHRRRMRALPLKGVCARRCLFLQDVS